MANTKGLNPRAQGLLAALQGQFPDLNVLSGYRDEAHNAAVGGAKNSRHIHGDAIDLSLQGMDDAHRTGLLNLALQNGAHGVGIYPSGNSMHLDVRDNPTAWGPLPNHHQGTRDVSLFPQWAQQPLTGLFGGQQQAPLPQQPQQPRIAQATPQAQQQPMQQMAQAAPQQAPMQIMPQDAGQGGAPPQGLLASLGAEKPQNSQSNIYGLLAQLMQQQAAEQNKRLLPPLSQQV